MKKKDEENLLAVLGAIKTRLFALEAERVGNEELAAGIELKKWCLDRAPKLNKEGLVQAKAMYLFFKEDDDD